jgi:hypothetical protein
MQITREAHSLLEGSVDANERVRGKQTDELAPRHHCFDEVQGTVNQHPTYLSLMEIHQTSFV